MNRRKFLTNAMALQATPNFISQNSPIFKIAVYSHFAPMSELIAGTWEGFYIDLAQRITRDIKGSQLNFIPDIMWNRLIQSIEYGRIDMFYRVSYRKDRLSKIDYIGATGRQEKYIIVAEDNPINSIDTYEDLASFTPPIVIEKSIAYDPEFDRRIKEDESFRKKFNIENWFITTDEAPLKQFLQLISTGHESGFIIDGNDAPKFIEMAADIANSKKGYKKLKVLKINCFADEITYLAASRKVPEAYRMQMKKSYRAARQDGSFELIWSKWWQDMQPPPKIPESD